MTNPESLHLTNVLVVTGLDASHDIQAMLQDTGKFYCQTIARTQLNFVDEANTPDIIVIDVQQISDIEIALINELHLNFRGVAIIVISAQLQQQQFRLLLQSGVQDWLSGPVSKQELIVTLSKWSSLRKSNNNKVHAIVSAAGGVGTSSLAVTLANILSDQQQQKTQSTALVDLDFSLGNCGNYLNTDNHMDLEQVLKEPKRLDKEIIDLISVPHHSGVHVYSYKSPTLGINANINEMTLRLLDLISMSHDISIIDIPYYEQPWKDHVLAAVDSISIVTTASIANIKHAHDLVKRIQKLRGEDAPITVVINKHQKQWFVCRMDDARAKEVFAGLEVCYLPRDTATMEDSISQGISAYEANQSSSYVKQASKLTQMLNQWVQDDSGG